MRLAVLAAATCLSIIGLSAASESKAISTRYELNIPRQSLDAALKELARQTGLQIARFSDTIAGGTLVGPITGHLSAEDALKSLLTPSGLTYKLVNERTIAVVDPKDIPLTLNNSSSSVRGAGIETAHGSLRLAQSINSSVGTEEGNAPSARSDKSRAEDAEVSESQELPAPGETGKGIPELLVIGKSGWSLNADIERTRDDVRPYVVLDRKSIQSSGALSVDELLRKRLTMSYVQFPTELINTAGSTVGNQSTIALRGLDPTQTLILIDGRRSTVSRDRTQEFQSNLNGIPLSAIERIEVLPTSAAGIYGGNATGGVVNVVLRRDYRGLETDINYESTIDSGGSTAGVSLYGGFSPNDGATTIQVSANYSDSDPLLLRQREFYLERRHIVESRRIQANPVSFYAAAPPLGATVNVCSGTQLFGTVFRCNTNPLVLDSGETLGSPRTSLPVDYAGYGSDGGAALLTNAGVYNRDLASTDQLAGGESSFRGAPSLKSVTTTFRQEITENADGFLELGATRNDQSFEQSILTATFALPADSPSNPFAQSIVVNAPLHQNATVRTESEDLRALAGMSARLGEEWSLAVDYSFSRNDVSQTSPAVAFTEELTAAVTSGAIDLLDDPESYAASLLAGLSPASFSDPTHARLSDATVRLAGPLGTLPAGRAVLSIQAEQREQYFSPWRYRSYNPDGTINSGSYTDGEAEAGSVYAELRLPLASAERQILGLRMAELQLAGRYDRYSSLAIADSSAEEFDRAKGKFDSVDYSAAFRLEPITGIMLRASFGTGFLPPYLGQLQPAIPFSFPLGDAGLTDPKRGGEPLGTVAIEDGGRPDLGPERSESLSAGIILTPTFISGLRLSFDWTKIRKKENITDLFLEQVTIDQEDALPGVVTRDPAAPGDPFGVGPIVGLDVRNLNATSGLSESYDFSLDYEIQTSRFGEFALRGLATRLIHNSIQTAPLTDPLEQVETVVSPAWSATATLSWKWRALTALWTTQFLDAYWLNADRSFNVRQGSDHVPSATYHDLAFGYSFEDASTSLLKGSSLWLGVKNVLNEEPRFSGLNSTFYDFWSDPRMATYFLSFRKSFSDK